MYVFLFHYHPYCVHCGLIGDVILAESTYIKARRLTQRETVEGARGDYYGIEIFRVYIKWCMTLRSLLRVIFTPMSSTLCSDGIMFRTDTMNTDYAAKRRLAQFFFFEQ